MDVIILYDILRYIKSPEDLCRITHVCQLWYYVAINSTTWEAMSVLAKHHKLHKSKEDQLLFACQYGHLKIIQWLYFACSLTVEDVGLYYYNCPLQLACENVHLHVIQWICKTFELTGEDWNDLVLRYAFIKGCLDVVQYFCETFELTVEDIRSHDNWLLSMAYINKHFHVIQWICEHFRLDYEREISALYEKYKV